MKKIFLFSLFMFVHTLQANDLSHSIKQTNLEQVKKDLALAKADLTPDQVTQYANLAKKITQLRYDQFITGEKLYNAWLAPTAQIFPATIASWCVTAACFVGVALKCNSLLQKSYELDIELELIKTPVFFLGGLLINRFARHYFEYKALKNQYDNALSIEKLFRKNRALELSKK